MSASARLSIPFVDESQWPSMPAANFRNKVYPLVHCEAKLDNGASDAACSRKGIVR
jgi:hypothetical protein